MARRVYDPGAMDQKPQGYTASIAAVPIVMAVPVPPPAPAQPPALPMTSLTLAHRSADGSVWAAQLSTTDARVAQALALCATLVLVGGLIYLMASA